MAKAKAKRQKLLSSSRPISSSTTTKTSSHSSKSTRTTIRSYHTLQKRLSQALADGDEDLAATLQSQLSASGGLEAYQAASTLGQSAQRGGDTSKVLVEWLQPVMREACQPLRILEVGALSTMNALNIPGKTVVRRIDLRSNAAEIEEQDFMTLSTEQPWDGSVKYDVLSLSLVVNFVGDSGGRGRMLQRTTKFLGASAALEGSGQLPALFLVLPLPCVDNSRYLTEDRLGEIMVSLGYEQLQVKKTNKLYYSLWRYDSNKETTATSVFKKEELRSGRDRNNFCIVLDGVDNG